MQGLPQIDRQVYELRDLQQLPGEEVAKRLKISLSATKSRLHRAGRMLRERLDGALGIQETKEEVWKSR